MEVSGQLHDPAISTLNGTAPSTNSIKFWVSNWSQRCRGKKEVLRVFYVYGSVHHNIFYEITNRCSYMQSILFHC